MREDNTPRDRVYNGEYPVYYINLFTHHTTASTGFDLSNTVLIFYPFLLYTPSYFTHPGREMQSVDPRSLSVLQTRVLYVKSFTNFTETDATALHAARPVV